MKMKLECKRQTMEISCVFIDYYMTSCPPVYSLIYIFSMKKLVHGEAVSIVDVARQFNVTESDVLNAWKHWESVGIVALEGSDKDLSVVFLPVNAPAPEKNETVAALPAIKPTIGARPQYTIDELTVYRQQSQDIARIFERAEQTLGKLLYYNDMNVLFSFHDWLRLPLDVIEYLLVYCADNGHRNLRYIEKCALDWADNGIDDLEKALQYVQNFDKNYRTILHYMGQNSGYPTPSHRKYMDKWLDEWKMSLDLIMEACDRCVSQIDKPKFNYVDKILADWHKKGIVDIAGVKAADAEFAKGKETGIISIDKIEKKPPKPKASRFVNFAQRDNDYSQWEQMERAYLEQKLK
ncbi:MAG: DnaD domain protein [Defluviitaleaceae bacterium]|nr:DnaD domain protein [Defluviitaleaceae bacterium]